jgi:hypothetical protein
MSKEIHYAGCEVRTKEKSLRIFVGKMEEESMVRKRSFELASGMG